MSAVDQARAEAELAHKWRDSVRATFYYDPSRLVVTEEVPAWGAAKPFTRTYKFQDDDTARFFLLTQALLQRGFDVEVTSEGPTLSLTARSAGLDVSISFPRNARREGHEWLEAHGFCARLHEIIELFESIFPRVVYPNQISPAILTRMIDAAVQGLRLGEVAELDVPPEAFWTAKQLAEAAGWFAAGTADSPMRLQLRHPLRGDLYPPGEAPRRLEVRYVQGKGWQVRRHAGARESWAGRADPSLRELWDEHAIQPEDPKHADGQWHVVTVRLLPKSVDFILGPKLAARIGPELRGRQLTWTHTHKDSSNKDVGSVFLRLKKIATDVRREDLAK